jgi:hypothetical protein
VAFPAGARVIATSARLMIEKCDCNAAPCVCSTTPYLARVEAVTAGADRPGLDRLDGPSPSDRAIELPSALYWALTRAGFDHCEGFEDTLSDYQLATLMSRADSIATRIGLKQLCDAVGILPRAPRQ